MITRVQFLCVRFILFRVTFNLLHFFIILFCKNINNLFVHSFYILISFAVGLGMAQVNQT